MATKALKAEANDNREPREFEFEGNAYTVPHPDDWTIDVVEAYEEGKLITAVRHILGPVQWKQYKLRHPKAKVAGDFIEAMFEDSGVNSGE
jgi:hypothetical protein